MNTIEVNSFWRYRGPAKDVPTQVHQVIFAKPYEVISIGLPFGTGGSFIGDAKQFLEEFQFVRHPIKNE